MTDQEAKGVTKIIGSVIIALSGLILFSDKVITIELNNNYGFKSTASFLWVFSQTLSPILILIGSLFKPFRTAYLVPVYIYTIQLYWVFVPGIKFDNYFLQSYAIGACIGYVLLCYLIVRFNQIKSIKEKENEEFQKEIKETIELLKKETVSPTV